MAEGAETQAGSESLSETISNAIDATETEGAEAPAPQQQVETYEPFEHWPNDRKDMFRTIPPNVQKHWLDYDRDYTRRMDQRAQEAARYKRMYEPIAELFEPYKQELELGGVDQVAAIRQLLGIYGNLKSDPQGTVRWLAQQYGVDLNQLTQQQQNVDPALQAALQKVQQLEQKFTGFMNTSQQTQMQQMQAQITRFADAKDEQGNLLHPFLDLRDEGDGRVASRMASLIKVAGQEGQTLSIEDAYEQAVWSLSDVRTKVQAQRAEAEKREKAAEQAKKVADAKKATFGVQQGQSGQGGNSLNLRDEIEKSGSKAGVW